MFLKYVLKHISMSLVVSHTSWCSKDMKETQLHFVWDDVAFDLWKKHKGFWFHCVCGFCGSNDCLFMSLCFSTELQFHLWTCYRCVTVHKSSCFIFWLLLKWNWNWTGLIFSAYVGSRSNYCTSKFTHTSHSTHNMSHSQLYLLILSEVEFESINLQLPGINPLLASFHYRNANVFEISY